MDTEKERLKILDMIDSGQISVQEGIQLLNALPDGEEAGAALLERSQTAPNDLITLAQQVELNAEPDSPVIPSEPEPQATPPVIPVAAPEEPQFEAIPEPVFTETPPAEERAVPFESEPEVIPPVERFDPSKFKWRNFWMIPMWVGTGILLIGALLMYWAWSAGGFGFWFACAWFPFLLGVAVMALAWSSRTARWLHVRVHQKPGERPERIAISLPIPLRLTAWLLRTFGHKIPTMEGTSLDEIIMALDATSPEAPFYVEVNEGEDGERVEVYIG